MEFGLDADAMREIAVVVVGTAALIWLIALASRARRKPSDPPQPTHPTKKPREHRGRAIIVDGSNVMHWGGDPSPLVLTRVVQTLITHGYDPHVYFDANIGYKLYDKFTSADDMAAMMSLASDQVTICPSGTPADEHLIADALRNRLQIVSNDRFRDWRGQFPKLGSKGVLVRGGWKEGSVVGLKPKRVPRRLKPR